MNWVHINPYQVNWDQWISLFLMAYTSKQLFFKSILYIYICFDTSKQNKWLSTKQLELPTKLVFGREICLSGGFDL